ncbi:MAG: CCC motif membrane protein [Bacteroidota bacterium]|nr:CCC motif membrane protein [uncultured Allomuricauda sp.]
MEQQKLPNSTLILVFGIISIVTCCCYGILGLIFGIIAVVLANKALKLYAENPEMYEDPKNVKTGKILAIIGIVLNVIYLLMTIWAYSYIGWENMQDPEKIQELLEQLQ